MIPPAPAPIPVGTIVPVAQLGLNNPEKYGLLPCDGRYIKADQYTEYRDNIGWAYGGSGNDMRLPDFRGIMLKGRNTNSIDGAQWRANDYNIEYDSLPAIWGSFAYASDGHIYFDDERWQYTGAFELIWDNTTCGVGHRHDHDNSKGWFNAQKCSKSYRDAYNTDNRVIPANFGVTYYIKVKS